PRLRVVHRPGTAIDEPPDRWRARRGLAIWEARLVKYVLFYESADDVVGRAAPHFPAHRARLDEFHARGHLLMAGTFADPQQDGPMAIFATRDAAEEFVRDDPFVLNGVVRSWKILDWHEALVP